MKPYNLKLRARKFDWGTHIFVPLGKHHRKNMNITVHGFNGKEIQGSIELSKTKKGNLKIIPSKDYDNWLVLFKDFEELRFPHDFERNVQVVDWAFGKSGRLNALLIVQDGTIIEKVSRKANENGYMFYYFNEENTVPIWKTEFAKFIETQPLVNSTTCDKEDMEIHVSQDKDGCIRFYDYYHINEENIIYECGK
jgi:hypothetical protein